MRCPWHGYDYDPITGTPPGHFSDAPQAFTVVEDDGQSWVALPDLVERARSVSDAMVETLVAWGIDTVFGMVGHSNLGFAEALRRAEARGQLRYIGIRHEGAASFAASAYGKLTGRPAVCFAIAGPGSTNMLTGLYDARLDSSPVVAISGQVPSDVRGKGAFQDLDLATVFGDVAVFSVTIESGSDHAELAAEAVKHALDRRGVAHLILPDEVQNQPSSVPPVMPAGRTSRVRGAPDPDAVRAGAGVLGRSGTPVASWLMNESDLLVVIGASFSNHTGIATYKPIVQIDDTATSIGRFDAVRVGLLGDAASSIRALTPLLTDVAACDQRGDVAARWAIWRAEKKRRLSDDHGRGIGSAKVFAALAQHCPADAVISVDVGNHAYSFGRYFESAGQPVLMSGYLGSIGFGYPGAMGALP